MIIQQILFIYNHILVEYLKNKWLYVYKED